MFVVGILLRSKCDHFVQGKKSDQIRNKIGF